jgi:hypothetical protein
MSSTYQEPKPIMTDQRQHCSKWLGLPPSPDSWLPEPTCKLQGPHVAETTSRRTHATVPFVIAVGKNCITLTTGPGLPFRSDPLRLDPASLSGRRCATRHQPKQTPQSPRTLVRRGNRWVFVDRRKHSRNNRQIAKSPNVPVSFQVCVICPCAM